jgi:hypothetical protein
VQPEPHSLSAAEAVKRCGSGTKPDVQNRTIKKKQVLRVAGKNFDAALAAPDSTLPSRPTFLKSKKVH